MADTHETIADIIAEMRALSNPISDGIIAINGRIIADRLEAAYKREVDALQAQVDELRLGIEQYRQYNARVVKECNDKVGNAAKLREAIDYLCERVADMDATFDPSEVECLRTALAAPPRNCDVGTVKEQSARFREFCKKDSMDSFAATAYCAYECSCGNNHDCKLAWAQMPYEEGGAK